VRVDDHTNEIPVAQALLPHLPLRGRVVTADALHTQTALAQVIVAWVGHLLGLGTRAEPLARVEDRDWRWFVGLDAEATRIGNALWRGEPLAEAALSRILALFALRFNDPSRAQTQLGDRPVYLLLAMTPDRVVRVKPQNLIARLPLAET